MSGFNATPEDVGGIPIASVVVPGNKTPVATKGGPATTDSQGNPLAGVSMYGYSGDIVDLATLLTLAGTPTDANTVASLMGRLTKIRDLLNATLTVQGTITEANSASILTDLATIISQTTTTPNVTDRWARQLGQVDVARVLGAAMSSTNPVITQSQLLAALLAGKLFMYSTPKLTGATSTGAACLFNPSGSGKNLLIVSIQVYCNAAAQGTVEMVTTDPALGTQMTIISAEGGSGAPASAISTSASYVASGVTPSTTPNRITSMAAGALTELLTNNNGIWLPSGVASGVKVTTTTPAANPLGFTFTAIEY